MISDPAIRSALSALAILLLLDVAASPSEVMAASVARSNTEDLLRRMASEAQDDCSAPAASTSSSTDVSRLENQLFEAAKALVVDRLNASSPALSSNAGSRAISALREVEQSSSEINKSWPADDRFHFQVLVLPPAILVQLTFRDQTVFVLFASYYLNKYASVDPGTKWREVGLIDPNHAASAIDLFPLHRGQAVMSVSWRKFGIPAARDRSAKAIMATNGPPMTGSSPPKS